MPNQRPHESARACGCDSAVDHVCDGHGAAHDGTRTTIAGGQAYDIRHKFWSDDEMYVSGPDEDGCFCILPPSESHWFRLPRFVTEDLIRELQRRLDLKA